MSTPENFTPAAARLLTEALARHPELPRDSWGHYATAMGSDGNSIFRYDRVASDRSFIALAVETGGTITVRYFGADGYPENVDSGPPSEDDDEAYDEGSSPSGWRGAGNGFSAAYVPASPHGGSFWKAGS